MRSLIFTLLFSLAVCGCQADRTTYYVQSVTFPEGVTLEEKIDLAARVVPTPEQLSWQQMELTAFLHFGMNTFTGNEWGNGKDAPECFAPTDLDCEQWVRALRDGGFKMAILTAKHHDGFCLWPTATTDYSVKQSPWKNGQGDVVRELRDACEKYGLKFGVYLSPWDRNAPCYGDSPAYNQLFAAQLTELLTQYGEIHEVWFDGANGEGPNGRKQVYDWDLFLSTIQKFQPKAVTAIMGDDVRWVGNESGWGRKTEWSVTPLVPGSLPESDAKNAALGICQTSQDLGSRALLEKAQTVYWYPSEVDVSIRPGWFYHPEEDAKVRSLENLVDIYYQSVGRNSVLLLNIPPDRRGQIAEVDVQRIREFNDYLTRTFAENHLLNSSKLPKTVQAGSELVFDTDQKLVNTFLIQEDIIRGQRIEEFYIEALVDGAWTRIGEGSTVGYKRLIRFPSLTADQVRLTIVASRGPVTLASVGLYFAPEK
ncbi:MAG: alpha-L-fucosidase [Bacteroidales bacterium]|nr:alpha-L-fucosidase [Bacteroidales bacterium]